MQGTADDVSRKFKLLLSFNYKFSRTLVLLSQVFCGKANEKQLSVESLQSYIDVMVRQIRDSHEKKEEALENRLRELKVTIRDMVQKHESLSSAYRYIAILHGRLL